MSLNEHNINKIINEELTKVEVRNIVSSKLDDFLKDRDFKKKVKEIAVDILDDFFRDMWHKKSFWKTSLKNS